MAMMEKKKLSKLSMPEKRKDEMDLEEMDLGSEEEMPMAEEEEMAGEELSMEEGPASDLEAISDDDLLAEIKKRGLMSQLSEKEDESEDQDMYS